MRRVAFNNNYNFEKKFMSFTIKASVSVRLVFVVSFRSPLWSSKAVRLMESSFYPLGHFLVSSCPQPVVPAGTSCCCLVPMGQSHFSFMKHLNQQASTGRRFNAASVKQLNITIHMTVVDQQTVSNKQLYNITLTVCHCS